MIIGLYYDGITSKPHACELSVNQLGQASLSGIELKVYSFESLDISKRVGNTARAIQFPGKGRFETQDNDGIDLLITEHKPEQSTLLSAHRWESKLWLTSIAAVITAVLLISFVSVGIPAAAEAVSHRLPSYVPISLAEETIEELDGDYFKKSELGVERQKHIEALLSTYTPRDSDFNYRVLLRKGGRFGANAIALPDGTIVITDELIELSAHDEEIIAVLLHEIGHIEHRHSLRNLLEAAGLYAMYSWMTGDIEVSSVSLLTFSGLILKASYSREHESEADNYSLNNMLSNDINPNHFASIMQKITIAQKEARSMLADSDDKSASEIDEAESSKNQAKNSKSNEKAKIILDYLSSHPSTKKRKQIFRDAANSNGYPALESD